MQSPSVRSEQDRQAMIRAATDIRLWPTKEIEILGRALSTYAENAVNYREAWDSLIRRISNELVRREREGIE